MSNLTAIVSNDGEVISMSDFGSEKEFQYKVLNNLDFETIKDFFIKKTIIDTVREKHKTSKGSNGVTTVEISNLPNTHLHYLISVHSKLPSNSSK